MPFINSVFIDSAIIFLLGHNSVGCNGSRFTVSSPVRGRPMWKPADRMASSMVGDRAGVIENTHGQASAIGVSPQLHDPDRVAEFGRHVATCRSEEASFLGRR